MDPERREEDAISGRSARARRFPCRLDRALVGHTLVLFLIGPAWAPADQIDVAGKRLPRGKVIGIENGELRFRKESLEIIGVRIGDVERIYVDPVGDFADFNAAEESLAGGDTAKSTQRYERSLRTAEGFWADLIRVRLLIAYDRMGEADKATAMFVRVLEGESTGPAVAAQVMPTNLPHQSDAVVKQAVDALDRASGRNSTQERRALSLLLKYDLLRTAGDERAKPMTPIVAELQVPAGVLTPRGAGVQLAALQAALAANAEPRALTWLDQALSSAPPFAAPGLLLLKGRTLLQRASTREDRIHAGWEFMRVVAHFPDDPLCADALLGAAEVHMAIGRTDRARALLDECVRHPKATPETKQAAQERLRGLAG